MKLARMLRVRATMSSGRAAEDRIRELFGESESGESGAVEMGRKLLRRREEMLEEA
jgi:hypothetical protein